MQTWRVASLVGFVIAGMSLAGPSLNAQQQLPSPEPPGNQQSAPSFTQPPVIDLLETFNALKENMLEESKAAMRELMNKTAPDPTRMIRVSNAICTMIVVPVDSSLDPEFVKEAPATATRMPVVQPFCRSTPQRP